MKKFKLMIVLLCIVVFSTSFLAQEWTDAQKEVWKNIETYWKSFEQGDADGMLSYFHENYKGWENDSPLPNGKATTEKEIKYFLQNNKIVLNQIDPVAIEIYGDFAFVHYYFDTTSKNAEGKDNNQKGRWTDILKKQGNKWMLIGDHGGG